MKRTQYRIAQFSFGQWQPRRTVPGFNDLELAQYFLRRESHGNEEAVFQIQSRQVETTDWTPVEADDGN